jgi:(+)-trans-carveol dehydrogenase
MRPGILIVAIMLWVEPVDIANPVLFLVSDEARYITGISLPVDLGSPLK